MCVCGGGGGGRGEDAENIWGIPDVQCERPIMGIIRLVVRMGLIVRGRPYVGHPIPFFRCGIYRLRRVC